MLDDHDWTGLFDADLSHRRFQHWCERDGPNLPD
jgi:hypothetical protein